MKNIILLKFLLIAISINSQNSFKSISIDNKIITIRGKIIKQNKTNKQNVIELHAKDYITKNLITESIVIKPTGIFEFQFKLEEQQDITLLYNFPLNLLVKPGDMIDLEIDHNSKTNYSFLSNLKISGKGSRINKNLIQFLLNNPLDYDLLSKKRKEIKPVKYQFFKDSLYKLRYKFIDKLLINKSLSKPFKKWLEAEKFFAYPSVFGFNNLYKSKQKETFKIKNYNYNLNNLPLVKSEHLINTNISNTLSKDILTFYILSNQAEIGQLTPEKSFNFLFQKIQEQNINQPFLIKILFNELVRIYFNMQNNSIYEDNIEIINKNLKNSIFFKPLKVTYNEIIENKKSPIKNKKIIIVEDESKEIVKNIIELSKNKIIYLNNWASWCEPCVKEFKKNTPKLYAEFEKDVEFIHLCYQSEKESWKAIIKKYNVKGKHYFVNKSKENSLKKIFSVKGFPTYVIINKKGEIINSTKNFKPSSIETIKKLNELKKK